MYYYYRGIATGSDFLFVAGFGFLIELNFIFVWVKTDLANQVAVWNNIFKTILPDQPITSVVSLHDLFDLIIDYTNMENRI